MTKLRGRGGELCRVATADLLSTDQKVSTFRWRLFELAKKGPLRMSALGSGTVYFLTPHPPSGLSPGLYVCAPSSQPHLSCSSLAL